MHTMHSFSILNALQISVTLFPKTQKPTEWKIISKFGVHVIITWNATNEHRVLTEKISRVASALLRKETIFSVWSFVFFTIVKPVYFLITPRILEETNFEYWIAWFVYVYSSWRRGRNRARRREYFHRCPPAHIKAHVLLNTPREFYDISFFVTHTFPCQPTLTMPLYGIVLILYRIHHFYRQNYIDVWPVY